MKSITSKLPIKITMPILLSLPVVTVVAVLSTVAFVQERRSMNQLAGQSLLLVHDRIAGRLDELLWVPVRLTRLNVSLIQQGKLDIDSPRQWRETVWAEMTSFDMLSSVTWGNEKDGSTMWVARYAGEDYLTFAIKDDLTGKQCHDFRLGDRGEIIGEALSKYDFDVHGRPWYAEPRAAGKPTWGKPFVWIDEEGKKPPTLGISYGSPVRSESGEIAGVIDAELTLYDISRFLETLSVGKAGMAFVVDREGLLVANSSGVDVTGIVNGSLAQLPARLSSDERISTAAENLRENSQTGGAPVGPYQAKISVRGETHLLMASPFDHATGLKWCIITVVPERDFLAAVYTRRQRSIVIGAVAVAATLGLGVLLAMWLVRPFLSLVSQLRRIGSGEIEHQVHLNQTPEFAQLSNEINRMSAGLRDRMRMRQSLDLAMEVQQNLLPTTALVVEGLDIVGHSIYCDETGGDYYDFLDVTGLSRSTAAIAIGDVTGHGIAAAMLMATARGILRSRANEHGSLGDLLTHTNDLLVRDTTGGRFMTMFLMTIDGLRHEVRWASAGHDPPFVYDPDTDVFLDVEGGNLPLGVLAGTTYEEYMISDVKSGQIYVAATDGVWETFNAARDQFGKDRVREIIRRSAGRSAREISDELRAALEEFRGESSQDDDVTFVVTKVL